MAKESVYNLCLPGGRTLFFMSVDNAKGCERKRSTKINGPTIKQSLSDAA